MLSYRRRIHLITWIVFLFLVDRGVKEWVQHQLFQGDSIPIIPHVFHITFVHNSGAAFSLFREHPLPLLWVTIGLFSIFLFYSLLKPQLNQWEVSALSLILGGALGNIADRLMLGRVIDYLDLAWIDYPIFNLADVFIFCGICLFISHYVFQTRKNHLQLSSF